MANILFGLIPALMWGIQPLVMTRLGGRSSKKVMGMALGIFLASLLVFVFKRPLVLTRKIFIISFIDGLALSFGLIKQIKGLEILGVAKGTPISTGTQLIGASLIGAIYFGEWTRLGQYILGLSALALIIIGVALTAFQEDKAPGSSSATKKGILTLCLSSLGFVAYTVILQLAKISIWDAILPQGLGILFASSILAKQESREPLFTKTSLRHILTGLIFALGNLTLMLSNVKNGLAVGFTLTQMSVVIASLGGLLVLKEPKTRKELALTLVGLGLVVAGGIMIGITKL